MLLTIFGSSLKVHDSTSDDQPLDYEIEFVLDELHTEEFYYIVVVTLCTFMAVMWLIILKINAICNSLSMVYVSHIKI
jgi:hypothetical protein